MLECEGGGKGAGGGAMKALIQRVSEAEVAVGDEVVGEIGPGLLVLLCAERGDGVAQADALARNTKSR